MMKTVLKEHFARYPKMEPTDAVKLLYQSVLGGGHLISDPERVRAYLEQERALSSQTGSPVLEAIGAEVYRLHLGSLPEDFSTGTVFEMFCLSAQEIRGQKETFLTCLDSLRDLADEAPFTREALEAYLADYLAAGAPMVSHSEAYRAAYGPHYRVISAMFARIWNLLCEVESRLAKKESVRIVIDGPSGTGKSTLAARLQAVYHCPVYHMDDFFLTPEAKTPERLALPGGNVDHERFREEILVPVMENRPVTYRPYICYLGHLGGAVTHAPHPVTIIEGAYSNHENLRDLDAIRIKLTLPLETRLSRIRARDGQEMLERFLAEWIPLEDHYFQKMATDETFDYLFAM